jgi:2,3-bisphosphoglycerate-dependent phosphoglycerate mutase
MQFYFIRHAQSANNLLWDTTGDSKGRSHDPELTPTGCKQIQVLAKFLRTGDPYWGYRGTWRDNRMTTQPGFGLTHLYTSLMERAVETGYAVAQELGLPLVAWVDLHETGGIYLDDENGNPIGLPGKTRAEFEQRYPNLILPATLDSAGWWNRPFEQEAEYPVRAQRILDELLRRHGGTDDRVAVFSHGAIYNHLLRRIFKIERADCWFGMLNCAITRIDFHEDNSAALIYANRLDFMPSEWVT